MAPVLQQLRILIPQDQAMPSLKCPNVNDRFTVSTDNGNGALTYPIGLMITDETILSGEKVYNKINNSYISNTDFYLYNKYSYWTMTPSFLVNRAAYIDRINMGKVIDSTTNGVRPVISLKSDVAISGEGTMNNPFTVE